MRAHIKLFKRIFASKISQLAVSAMVAYIAVSMIDTIWSVFVDEKFNDPSLVGYFVGFLSVIALLTNVFISPFLQKFNKSRLYLGTLVGIGICYLLFIFSNSTYIFGLLAILMTFFYTLRLNVAGMIVKEQSKDDELVKNEGFVYATTNTAWIFGPLIAGFVASKYGNDSVFIIAAILSFLGAFSFWKLNLKSSVRPEKIVPIFKGIKDFFKDNRVVLTYFISGGVNFWWTLIYIFVPLYALHKGYDEAVIGIFFFANTIPLVFGEYFLPKFVDKLGFRKTFIIGFASLSVLSFFAFIIDVPIIVLVLMVLASFAAALVEPSTEAFFFKNAQEKASEYYGLYNTTSDLHQFIARIATATVLIFLPIEYIFLVFGIFMAFFVLLSLKVKKDPFLIAKTPST